MTCNTMIIYSHNVDFLFLFFWDDSYNTLKKSEKQNEWKWGVGRSEIGVDPKLILTIGPMGLVQS